MDPLPANGLAAQIATVFQPIVDLADGGVVGFEALTRLTHGDPIASPLFELSRSAEDLAELDRVARVSALEAIAASTLPPQLAWFLNVEPVGLAADDLAASAFPSGPRPPQLVYEITERALTWQPGRLMDFVAAARERGFAVAVDDVGATPESLALLPIVRPSVVKLDIEIIQHHTTGYAAAVTNAVRSHAETTDAVILAEGIETEQHVEAAALCGASHGQGYLFGRAGALPRVLPAPERPLALLPSRVSTFRATPWELVTAHRAPQRGTRRFLETVSRHLETQAASYGDSYLVFAALQNLDSWSGGMRLRHETLARKALSVMTFGTGREPRPSGGVRHTVIDAADPLAHEWDVIVVGPHFAAALVAHDLGDSDAFDYVITYDQRLVASLASSLFYRVAPL